MMSFMGVSLHAACKKIARIDTRNLPTGFFELDSDFFKLMTVLLIVIVQNNIGPVSRPGPNIRE